MKPASNVGAPGSMRDLFELPPGKIYLDGNSLGPLPRTVKPRMDQVISDEWGKDLISSWNTHDWIDLPLIVGNRIARLIGAAPGQVICTDSISVNLFKLITAALRDQPGRHVVVTDHTNFPTDIYMAQGVEALLGAQQCELRLVDASTIEAAIDESVALVMLSHVDFRTGEIRDMAEITRAAHARGARVLWDLAHSAGAMPVALDELCIDYAVGCGYKYLNGGPGAPAWLYVAENHHASAAQPLSGWMGHSSPFDFDVNYIPAPGIRRFLSGTPGILGLSALDAALDVFNGVDLDVLRQTAIQLVDRFIGRIEQHPELACLERPGPVAAARRGNQVSLRHPNAFAIVQALIGEGVVGDFREPDIMRFGFNPMYLSGTDIDAAVSRLAGIVTNKTYLEARFSERSTVT